MLNICDFIQVYVYTTNHHLKQLYDKAISEVQVNGITEEWLIISLNETMPSLAYSLLHFFSKKGYL